VLRLLLAARYAQEHHAASGSNTAARRNLVERILKRIKAKARSSGGFLYAAVTDAGRANSDMLRRCAHHGAKRAAG